MTMLGRIRQRQEDEKPEIRISRPAKTSHTEDFYKAVMIQSQHLRLKYAAKAPLLHIIMLNFFFAEAKILMSPKEQFWTRNSAQNTLSRLQQQYFKRLINVC